MKVQNTEVFHFEFLRKLLSGQPPICIRQRAFGVYECGLNLDGGYHHGSRPDCLGTDLLHCCSCLCMSLTLLECFLFRALFCSISSSRAMVSCSTDGGKYVYMCECVYVCVCVCVCVGVLYYLSMQKFHRTN